MMRIKAFFASLLALLIVILPAVAASSTSSKSWDFSVLLDGNEIGYHRFELFEDGDERRITSEAKCALSFRQRVSLPA